ncbi:MAG: S8 family serine peptidase [Phycisphaerales bacterium JB037]
MLVAGLALSVLTPVSLADDAVDDTPVSIRTGSGVRAFTLGNAGGLASVATPIATRAFDKLGRPIEPSASWMFAARVIVRVDGDNLAAALDQPAARGIALAGVGPVPGTREHWAVETSSVIDAVRLADALAGAAGVRDAFVDAARPTAERVLPTDPNFMDQWHLHNTSNPVADLNVTPAWDLGFSGSGVVVGVIDTGLAQSTHPDYAARYIPQASILSGGLGAHATSVTGLIVAARDDGLGGLGVAYDAQWGTMPVGSASQTAQSFGHRNDLIDAKNNSWGPADGGFFAAMTSVEADALELAATTGRGGLGTVFLWAAGNGGTLDRVDYDGFASSRFSIAVGSIGDDDDAPSYNELGSSMFTVAPSAGGVRSIFTSDLIGAPGYSTGNYTDSFGGTSSASPQAAGVVALMLEANSTLSLRDIQHIFQQTARKCDPGDAAWRTNAAGVEHNEQYGFGAIDAEAAVLAAISWTPVAPETSATTGVVAVNEPLPDNTPTGVTRTATIADRITVEHVELVINAQAEYVGDLHIQLTAPTGTVSLLAKNPFTDSSQDLEDFVFTSVKHWGELSAGDWTIKVSDRGSGDSSTWLDYELRVFGTAVCPADWTGTSDPNEPGYGTPDGDADADDFFFYLDAFTTQTLGVCDLTGSSDPNEPSFGTPDGDCDADDFFRYLDLFVTGCS